MSAAETLREAAKALRDRAEEAPPGPWDHVVGASGDTAWVERRHTETIAVSANAAASAYIATMHPGVALALADWLDAEAQDQSHDPAEHDGSPSGYALRVAETVLGGAQ